MSEVSHETQRAVRSGEHDLPSRVPRYFQGRQIVYRELDIHSKPHPFYSRIDKPRDYRSFLRFKEIAALAASGHYPQKTKDVEERHELDIPIYHPSYIMLKMADGSPDFSFPAIRLTTPSKPYPDNDYGGLWYVEGTGRIHSNWFDGCRLVFFRAKLRKGTDHQPHLQGLWYYAGGMALAAIDPDIRHPGIGGQGIDPDP